MLAWYRKGINPQSHLPYLATYLGHKDINSTLVYLHKLAGSALQWTGNRTRTPLSNKFGVERPGTVRYKSRRFHGDRTLPSGGLRMRSMVKNDESLERREDS